jgi:sulfatase maturation enzyme AslB (radical SAM superfamily)
MSIINRVDNTTHIPSDRLIPNPPFPKSVKIEVTSRCNLSCSYCARAKSGRPSGDMPLPKFEQLVKRLVISGVEEVGLFYLGEPFVLKNIHKYIRVAKKAGVRYVFITTNGTLCDHRMLKLCIDAGLDSLKFSVNAYDRASYDKYHGVDLFDKIIANIKWLHTYKNCNRVKMSTCVSSIYFPGKEKELSDFKSMIENHTEEFYLLPLYNQGGNVTGNSTGNTGRLVNGVPPIPCWTLFNCAKITWDGKMTACCFDHSGDFEVGDLNIVSPEEAWNSDKFIALRNKHIDQSLSGSLCAKCLNIN